MKLTAQVKLVPTPHQAELLRATLERANTACNSISDYAWEHQVFSQFALHQVLYATLRETFDLSSQVTVRCLSKVADAYKKGKITKRFFKKHGSIAYDNRILSYRTDKKTVSIWLLGGRETMPYEGGEHQQQLLEHQQGESDLAYHRGEFYLLATCEVPEEPPDKVDEYLGIDRGVVNVATDSDGNLYTGTRVEQRRRRYAKQRRDLQKKK